MSKRPKELQPLSKKMIHHNHTSEDQEDSVARGGVVTPFPWKVHDMLEKAEVDGIDEVVSWLPHGRAFMVHNPDVFVNQVMPMWFQQTKFASFQRQLNLYGFRRLTSGRDRGAYYHEHFLREERNRIQRMSRQKVKGTKIRRGTVPGMEPDFWSMPPLTVPQSPLPFKVERVVSDSSLSTRGPPESSSSSSGPSTPTLSAEPEEKADILFFEGKPFHYLDRLFLCQAEVLEFMPLEDMC